MPNLLFFIIIYFYEVVSSVILTGTFAEFETSIQLTTAFHLPTYMYRHCNISKLYNFLLVAFMLSGFTYVAWELPNTDILSQWRWLFWTRHKEQGVWNTFFLIPRTTLVVPSTIAGLSIIIKVLLEKDTFITLKLYCQNLKQLLFYKNISLISTEP